MKIYFMRHGECKNQKSKNYHLQNTNLTKKGIAEAKLASSYFVPGEIAVIYSSPKKRALQTAQIVAKKIKCPIVVLEDVTERFKISEPRNEEEKEIYDNYMNYNYQNKNVQTCKDFVKLNQDALKKIINKHKKNDENVLIVGHSANLYALNSYFYGISNGNVVWVQCSNCAVIKWEVLK